MAQDKKINKESSIQKILDWGNKSIGHHIDINKLNQAMEKPDWEKTLKKMAKFCKVEIIYK